MAICNSDWLALLRDDSNIPTDISFKVEECNTDNHEIEFQSEVVKAHKFILSMASDIFRDQFMGTLKEENTIIEVKDTTIAAFKEFINLIYTKQITTITNIEEIFQVMILAQKYHIWSMKEKLEIMINNFEINIKNIIFNTMRAKYYSNVLGFENISKKFIIRCGKFLYEALPTKNDIALFLKKSIEDYPNIDANLLIELIALNAKCEMCMSNPCLNGKEVTEGNISSSCKFYGISGQTGRFFPSKGDIDLNQILETAKLNNVVKHIWYTIMINGNEMLAFMRRNFDNNFVYVCK